MEPNFYVSFVLRISLNIYHPFYPATKTIQTHPGCVKLMHSVEEGVTLSKCTIRFTWRTDCSHANKDMRQCVQLVGVSVTSNSVINKFCFHRMLLREYIIHVAKTVLYTLCQTWEASGIGVKWWKSLVISLDQAQYLMQLMLLTWIISKSSGRISDALWGLI